MSIQQEGLRGRYNRLMDEWRRGSEVMVSERAGIEHPAYKQLVALGRDGVRFLLADLRDGVQVPPAVHAWIVRHVGSDPVPPSVTESGDLQAVRDQLVQWGIHERRISAA
jgi:hypothetical protein